MATDGTHRPSPEPAGWSRRTFLGGLALAAPLLLAGCPSGRAATRSSGATASAAPDPLAAVLAQQVALRDRYDAALAAAPDLATAARPGATLAVLRDETDAHVRAVAAAMALRPPSASSAGTASPPPTTAAPAPDPAALVAGLLADEQALGVALDALALTVIAARAPLVGSVAASVACHVVVLS